MCKKVCKAAVETDGGGQSSRNRRQCCPNGSLGHPRREREGGGGSANGFAGNAVSVDPPAPVGFGEERPLRGWGKREGGGRANSGLVRIQHLYSTKSPPPRGLQHNHVTHITPPPV